MMDAEQIAGAAGVDDLMLVELPPASMIDTTAGVTSPPAKAEREEEEDSTGVATMQSGLWGLWNTVTNNDIVRSARMKVGGINGEKSAAHTKPCPHTYVVSIVVRCVGRLKKRCEAYPNMDCRRQ